MIHVVALHQKAGRGAAQPGASTSTLVAVTALAGLAALLLVVQNSTITTAGYEVRHLETKRDAWRQLNYQLEAEVAALQSLSRVEREAKERLGMIAAKSRIFLTIEGISAPERGAEDLPPGFVPATARQAVPWWRSLLERLNFRR